MIRLFFLLTLAMGLLAQWHVKRASARHSRTPVQSGYTGAEAAAWTYVAAFTLSLVYFLWHLLPLLTGRQRN